jgi:AraC family transcriptional regulator
VLAPFGDPDDDQALAAPRGDPDIELRASFGLRVCTMPGRHIEIVYDGRRQPAPTSALLSSSHSPWTGLLLERHALSGGHASSLRWPLPLVVLMAQGSLDIECRAMGKQHRFLAGPGSVTVWPGGYETARHAWTGDCEMVTVELSGTTLGQLADGDERLSAPSLAPQRGVDDPQLAALIGAIEAEVRAGCPAGQLFGESLSLAVAAYVAARYSTTPLKSPPPKGGLSRRRLKRVRDYIQTNLGRNLSGGITALGTLRAFTPAKATTVGRHPSDHIVQLIHLCTPWPL